MELVGTIHLAKTDFDHIIVKTEAKTISFLLSTSTTFDFSSIVNKTKLLEQLAPAAKSLHIGVKQD